MAYNIKDVFYLSTSTTVAAGTANGGSAQLDLSAYIDPIARGRTKGTGLAIYKVHVGIMQSGSDSDPIDDAEVGTFSYGLLAGAGFGDLTTGNLVVADDGYAMTNSLLIDSGQFYGPKSQIANACTTVSMFNRGIVTPSKDVPYVVVRDNVCLTYQVHDNMTEATDLSVRLECAQISLDQATLNQLLRTQTV
jgi:hypothetical protein